MAIAGWPIVFMNCSDGFPNNVTAATWSATADGIGCGIATACAPSGTRSAVTKPITAAPWEYPPSTMLVLGQLTAIDSI